MKKLVCFFIACIFTYHTEARDYYVSVSGGGNGSSAASPANVDDLRMLLAAYTAADDRQLNIWFDAGTYEIPYQGFRFGADADAAARGGLNVVFQPLASIVTFNGYQGQYIKLLHLAEGVSASKALTVTVENIHIENFTTTDDGSSWGNTSLFTVLRHNTLNLNSVTVNYINSKGNPFLALENGTVNIHQSTLRDIKNPNGPLFQTNYNSVDRIRFTNCVLSDWHTDNGYTVFYLRNAASSQAEILFRNCIISQNAFNGSFLVSNNSSSIVVDNTEFANLSMNVTGNHAYLFNVMHGGNLTVKDCIFADNYIRTEYFGSGHARVINVVDASLTMTGNTLSNNQLLERTKDNCMVYAAKWHNNTNILIVNNTFVNNFCSICSTGDDTYHNGYAGDNPLVDIYTNGAVSGHILNNTMDAGIYITTRSSLIVANNLVVTDNTKFHDVRGTISPPYDVAAPNTYADFRRNIFNSNFYETGVTNVTKHIPNVYGLVGGLTEYAPGKPKVRPLILNSKGGSPILNRGGTTTDNAGFAQHLVYDQKEEPRPEYISVGSWDAPNIHYDTEPIYRIPNL